MKKAFLLVIGLLILLMACSPSQEKTLGPNEIYTLAAKTVFVQMTQAAALTPSATPTPTLAPTLTPTIPPPPTNTPIPPTPTWTFNQAGKVTAPILLYNRIEDNNTDDANYHWESKINIPSDLFRQQMEILKTNGYTPIPISLLAKAVREGANLPDRPVVITFDVGAVGIYKKAFPIMKEFGFVGNLYITTNQLDAGWMITTSEVKELVAAGWEIGSKGYTGIDLTSNHTKLSDEIALSRTTLEQKIGASVVSFSYPYGKIDDVVGPRVADWGYSSAVGIFNTSEHTMNTIYYLARYEIRKDMTSEDFAAILPWKPEILPTTVPVNLGAPKK